MAAETPLATLAGLDNLELGPQPGRDLLRGTGGKALGSIWPKLLAIAIVLGLWELVYLSGYKPHVIFPGPATVLPNLWDQLRHVQPGQPIETTLRRAVIGFGLALVIGSLIGALDARIKPLRAAVGSMIP